VLQREVSHSTFQRGQPLHASGEHVVVLAEGTDVAVNHDDVYIATAMKQSGLTRHILAKFNKVGRYLFASA
jgi:hypothetical protein